jgi:hypothetical protein
MLGLAAPDLTTQVRVAIDDSHMDASFRRADRCHHACRPPTYDKNVESSLHFPTHLFLLPYPADTKSGSFGNGVFH